MTQILLMLKGSKDRVWRNGLTLQVAGLVLDTKEHEPGTIEVWDILTPPRIYVVQLGWNTGVHCVRRRDRFPTVLRGTFYALWRFGTVGNLYFNVKILSTFIRLS